jgi:hypothetical protein
MTDIGNHLPDWVHAFSTLLAHTNSACNPIIYSILNPTYLKSYKIFIKKISFSKIFKEEE